MRNRYIGMGLGVAMLLVLAAPSIRAQASAEVNTGDTAWLLISSALVMLMTAPGLAFFYGGLVGQRNVLSTLMYSFFLLCVISLQWTLLGYSLAFGESVRGIIGGLTHLGLRGVDGAAKAGMSVPHVAFAMFQGMFAVITVALITGAFVERINFRAFVLFALLWATLVYAPLAHWVWGGGWLMTLGALDFAGGTVVHISSGVSALIAARIVGRRTGYPDKISPPHNLPMTVLGAALLWFGWFGFNAGSALAANGLAAMAFMVTHVAAASAGFTWAVVEWIHRGKPTVLGTVTGAVAGLVAITPASGYVTTVSALIIGIGAGAVGYWGVNILKPRMGYDDSLDVFGIHGLCGSWGAIATGLFATRAVNPAGAEGALYGNVGQLGIQLVGVLAAWALAASMTWLILKGIALVMPLRVTQEDELAGLDIVAHGEVAYHFLAPGMGHAIPVSASSEVSAAERLAQERSPGG